MCGDLCNNSDLELTVCSLNWFSCLMKFPKNSVLFEANRSGIITAQTYRSTAEQCTRSLGWLWQNGRSRFVWNGGTKNNVNFIVQMKMRTSARKCNWQKISLHDFELYFNLACSLTVTMEISISLTNFLSLPITWTKICFTQLNTNNIVPCPWFLKLLIWWNQDSTVIITIKFYK